MTSVAGRWLVIDRPVEDVWAFITDISNMPKWEDSKAVWKQTSDGSIQVGSTIQSAITFLGRTVVFELRVATFDPSEDFTVEAATGRSKGTRISYLMEPVEGRKTRLRRVTDVRFRGLARVMQAVAGPIVRWTGELEVRNLQRLMQD
jgi:hypothetical protein